MSCTSSLAACAELSPTRNATMPDMSGAGLEASSAYTASSDGRGRVSKALYLSGAFEMS